MRSCFLTAFVPPFSLSLMLSTTAAAQSPGAGGPSIDPPPPQLPATFIRGEEGRSTIRAVRISEPILLDGRLDEEVYTRVQPASGFIQQEPTAGEPATEDTDVWVFFDDRNLYVGYRAHDSDPDRIVANEMRRDNNNIFQNDTITFIFDTFYDRRTAFYFQTNPLGALRDALVVSENSTNYDWSTVWDVRARRDAGGWIVEAAIPFKSLRYPRTTPQLWGFNVRRVLRGKNEQSLLSPVPRSYLGSGLQRISSASTLVGMEPPPASRNLELKPSFVGNVTTNRAAAPPTSNDLDGSFSLDTKYGLTNNLTADVTYNTDFAQVEIDEQQVNLTRFSLFFPEKRDFFLEGQNVFDFAGTGVITSQSDTPILFFTRRIGLNEGLPVPIRAGGRLTGRIGRMSVGFLDIGTDDVTSAEALATNFFVARIKRDILRRSSIGVLATRRTPSLVGSGSNNLYGIDANLAFYTNIQINSYYARSTTPGVKGDQASYRGDFRYAADKYGFELERLKTGPAFNPEIGYVRRPDTTRTSLNARFSPRPQSLRGVRKVGWEVSYDRFVDSGGVLESRPVQGIFRTDFESGDALTANYYSNYEFLDVPFRIPGSRVTLPIGRYRFDDAQASYILGPQRTLSGTVSFRAGDFYSGRHASASYTGRVKLSSQLAVEPRLSVDKVTLPQGRFTTRLMGARTTYTISPRMFASALVQYNSSTSTVETNARFRWEYQPGSDFYVVYTDGRDTTDTRFAELINRGLALKFTRLFRF